MIFLSRKDLDKQFYAFCPSYIANGSEGQTYHTGNNRVAKVFYQPLRLNKTNQENLLQFKDVEQKNFIFADELIYYPWKIGGVVMPCAPGKDLTHWYLCNVPIETLIASLKDLEEAIDIITEYGVLVDYDVSARNIMYDGQSFYFIDTMSYNRHYPLLDDTYNRREIFSVLYHKILNSRLVYSYFQDLYSFGDLVNSDILLEDPEEIIGGLQRKLELTLGSNITTFSEGAVKLAGRR